jgi:predicted phage terminase large subunit-like protein
MTNEFDPEKSESLQKLKEKLRLIQEERVKVASGFPDNKLPDYLVTYFDEKEESIKKGLTIVGHRAEVKFRKRILSLEERTWHAEQGKKKFWELNKYCLRKTPRTVGTHLSPVFEESGRNTEIAKTEAPLTPEEIAALKIMCSEDMYLFAIRYFNHYLKKPSSELHKFLYKYLTFNMNQKKRRKGLKTAIAAPRANSKCLEENTLVKMSDGSTKKIKDVESGDEVLSLRSDFKFILGKVLANVHSGKKECLKLVLESGDWLILSKNHWVLTYKGWKQARALTEEDYLASPDKSNTNILWSKITDITDAGIKDTYDLEVFSEEEETEGSYISNNIVSHNSSIVSTIFPIWCIVYGKKRFIMMISDTLTSAEDFLSDIKNELLYNELLKRDFPDACGKGVMWRSNEIITRNNIKVLALGTGNQVRGRRFGIYRPDLIVCHKEGTKILYNNEWINIEDHPSAVKKLDKGLEVKVWGLPESEIVTKEHRYWCRKIERHDVYLGNNKYKNVSFLSEPFWCEAQNLDSSCYIGSPIAIEDGFLWRKVREVEERKQYDVFVPIKTKDSTYITSFGLSHNCDDLESGQSVRSEAERDFIRKQWFDKDLLFVGGDEIADFLVVGTILGKSSLLNALLDPSEYPDWTSFKFRAVEEHSNSPLWDEWRKIFTNRLDSDREKKALEFFLSHKEEMLKGVKVLWPEGDPYYNLMVYKTSNPSGFISEKQNSPIDPSQILVSKEQLHFEHFSYPQWKDILSRCHYFGALDPSLGKKATSGDYSCICTVARDPQTGYLFVVGFDLKRRSVDDQIMAIIRNHQGSGLKQGYNYKLFGVETNAFQYVVAEGLRKKSREYGAYIPLKEIQSTQDKKMRFEGIVPLMTDGTIVFDADSYRISNQYNLAVEQITSCTGKDGEEDDSFDALAFAVNLAKKPRFRVITHQTRT